MQKKTCAYLNEFVYNIDTGIALARKLQTASNNNVCKIVIPPWIQNAQVHVVQHPTYEELCLKENLNNKPYKGHKVTIWSHCVQINWNYREL